MPGQLTYVLLSSLRGLESLLRSLRGAFKTLCPHLSGGTSLLLQNVALQLLLGNSLPGASKRATSYGACRNILPLQPALTSNVLKRLLYRGVFIRAHEPLSLVRREHRPCPRQRGDALRGDVATGLSGFL